MNKNTDWAAWDSEFGPRDMSEAKALKTVAEGKCQSGPFTGEWSSDRKVWLISRDRQRKLRLNGVSSQKGFVQFLWYYTSGQRSWRIAPRTLEAFF